MTFTDDDLKRLKERNPLQMKGAEILYLLARLEAAEKCLEAANQEGGIDSNLFKAWHKAAGK